MHANLQLEWQDFVMWINHTFNSDMWNHELSSVHRFKNLLGLPKYFLFERKCLHYLPININ